MSENVGFTGTRHGMTQPQMDAFCGLIDSMDIETFAHGDCVGADAQAHEAVFCRTFAKINVHPPVDASLAATCASNARVTRLPPKTHFARNRDIVNSTDRLIACPCEKWDTLPARGGTAYTIGYARKANKAVTVIWPDGTTTETFR